MILYWVRLTGNVFKRDSIETDWPEMFLNDDVERNSQLQNKKFTFHFEETSASMLDEALTLYWRFHG